MIAFILKIISMIKELTANGMATAKAECVEAIEPFTPLAITTDGKVQNPFVPLDSQWTASNVLDVYGTDADKYKYMDITVIPNTNRFFRTYVDPLDVSNFYTELIELNTVDKTIDILSTTGSIDTGYTIKYIATEFDETTSRLAVVTTYSYANSHITGLQLAGDTISFIATSVTIENFHLNGYHPMVVFRDGNGVTMDYPSIDKFVKFSITDTTVDILLATAYFSRSLNNYPYMQFFDTALNKTVTYSNYARYETVIDPTDYTLSTVEEIPLGGENISGFNTMIRDGDTIYCIDDRVDTLTEELKILKIDLAYPTNVVAIDPIPFNQNFYINYLQQPFSKNMHLSFNGKNYIVGTHQNLLAKRHRVYEVVPASDKQSITLVPTEIYPTESVDSIYARNDNFFGIYDDINDYMMFYNTSGTDTQYCDFVKAVDNISATPVVGFTTKAYAVGEKASIQSREKMYQTGLTGGTIIESEKMIVTENGVMIPIKE